MAQTEQLPAIEKVLTNYELLEHIFSHLELIDLMRIQQVCQNWHVLASRSQLLQQRLYLQAVDKKTTPTSKSAHFNEDQCSSPGANVDYIPHPLFSNVFVFRSRSSWSLHFLPSDLARLLSLRGMRWRDMFITQPPVRKLFVRVNLNTWAAVDSTSVSNSNGVKLGGVMRAINEVLVRNGVLVRHFGGESNPDDRVRKWLKESSGRDRNGNVVLIYWNWLNCEALI